MRHLLEAEESASRNLLNNEVARANQALGRRLCNIDVTLRRLVQGYAEGRCDVDAHRGDFAAWQEEIRAKVTRWENACAYMAGNSPQLPVGPVAARGPLAPVTPSPTAHGSPHDEPDDVPEPQEDFSAQDWRRATTFWPKRYPRSVRDIYDTFKGIGAYHNQPVRGGLLECDARWKASWRQHFEGKDKEYFRRGKIVTLAIIADERDDDMMIELFEQRFASKRRSLCDLWTWVKDKKYPGAPSTTDDADT